MTVAAQDQRGSVDIYQNFVDVKTAQFGSLLIGSLLTYAFWWTGSGDFIRAVIGPPATQASRPEPPISSVEPPVEPPVPKSDLNINGVSLGWSMHQVERHWNWHRGCTSAPGDFSGLFRLGPPLLTTPNGWAGYGGIHGLPPLTDVHYRNLGHGPADMIRGKNLYLKTRPVGPKTENLLLELGRPGSWRREMYWDLWIYHDRLLVVQVDNQERREAFNFLLGSDDPQFLDRI